MYNEWATLSDNSQHVRPVVLRNLESPIKVKRLTPTCCNQGNVTSWWCTLSVFIVGFYQSFSEQMLRGKGWGMIEKYSLSNKNQQSLWKMRLKSWEMLNQFYLCGLKSPGCVSTTEGTTLIITGLKGYATTFPLCFFKGHFFRNFASFCLFCFLCTDYPFIKVTPDFINNEWSIISCCLSFLLHLSLCLFLARWGLI